MLSTETTGVKGWPEGMTRGECSSIHKVTRELKKEQNSLFNCVNSIVHDAMFVQEV